MIKGKFENILHSVRQTLQSSLIGIQTLRNNPFRLFLTMLGVVIGVGSIVAILNLGDSLERYSREQLERTTNFQIIEINSLISETIDGVTVNLENPKILTQQDVESLSDVLRMRSAVTLTTKFSKWISNINDTSRYPSIIYGATVNAPLIFPIVLEYGRFFAQTEMNDYPQVTILSHRAASKLCKNGDIQSLLGDSIQIGNDHFFVIGILRQEKDEQSTRVLVPITSSLSLNSMKTDLKLPAINIKVFRIEEYDMVYQQVIEWIKRQYSTIDDKFIVSNLTARHEQLKKGMLIFKVVMGCIAGISLFVGGIGIMNILLASVSERTREIGIRRSLGARKKDILTQFLVESVFVSGSGGLLGIILGYCVSIAGIAVVRKLTESQMTTVMNWSSVVIACSAAFLVGIIFGLYPALRAAKLSPTDAIRSE
jgi:putative ABC transport system permease protein